jgi:hypothetical protein
MTKREPRGAAQRPIQEQVQEALAALEQSSTPHDRENLARAKRG